eukprot:scaffold3957_cov19-Prasinocladus_malaysianus.AAC.1
MPPAPMRQSRSSDHSLHAAIASTPPTVTIRNALVFNSVPFIWLEPMAMTFGWRPNQMTRGFLRAVFA